MVAKFTVFGSCACRDIFFSKINKNYKSYFQIGEDGIRISFISLMQQPVHYDEDALIIYPQNQKNTNYTNWIKKDLDKAFIKVLKENDFEYLLLDTYYDVNFGIVEFGDKQYFTRNLGIEETDFFKNLNPKRILTMRNNTEEYYKIWKKNCNLFFEFLEKNCPNLKVILNPNRHVYNLLKKDGTIVPSDSFKDHCESHNPYRNLLDEYIIENFDVEVLMFDENLLADENHVWGPYSLHYVPEYYTDMTKQLNQIIKRNEVLNMPEYYSLNEELRQEKRNRLLLKFRSQYTPEFMELRNKLNQENI